jgi:hypothetical protein
MKKIATVATSTKETWVEAVCAAATIAAVSITRGWAGPTSLVVIWVVCLVCLACLARATWVEWVAWAEWAAVWVIWEVWVVWAEVDLEEEVVWEGGEGEDLAVTWVEEVILEEGRTSILRSLDKVRHLLIAFVRVVFASR